MEESYLCGKEIGSNIVQIFAWFKHTSCYWQSRCGKTDNIWHIVPYVSSDLQHLRPPYNMAYWIETCKNHPHLFKPNNGSHIYIKAPPKTILAANHRNRNKPFSILLHEVVDSRFYFTSINTGHKGSLHDFLVIFHQFIMFVYSLINFSIPKTHNTHAPIQIVLQAVVP